MTAQLVKPDFDVIIALGGGVNSEGEIPQWVKTRLDRLADRHKEYPLKLIMSGKGKDKYALTEAEAMERYLVGEKGIPPEDVLIENLSTDTWESGYYTRTIHTDPLGIRKPLIVTSEFHMPRSKVIFDWVLHGDMYVLQFETVQNEGLDPEILKKRMDLEAKLTEFNEKRVLPHIRKGNLRDLHDFIFSQNTPGKEYREFLASLDLTPGYGRK